MTCGHPCRCRILAESGVRGVVELVRDDVGRIHVERLLRHLDVWMWPTTRCEIAGPDRCTPPAAAVQPARPAV
jgi:hypothetical protein